jgi:outer membrane protein assembly factor BamB
MLNVRRFGLMVVAAALLAAVVMLARTPPAADARQVVKAVRGGPPSLTDQPQPKQADYNSGSRFSAIKLVENEEFQKAIDQAIDASEGGAWADACDYLQAILDSKQDVYARVDITDPNTGQKKTRFISVKYEANNLLAKMPREGLNTYEVKFGAQARQLLDDAKKTGNREILAEVASRFLHTKAGADANELLATTFLDRGEYFPAALRYAMLIGPEPAKTSASDLTLFKAALASKRAGNVQQAAALWDALLPRIKSSGGLALANGQTASLKQIQAFYDEIHARAEANPHDWPLVGGNLARNAQAKGSPPMLDFTLWSRKTFMDVSDESGEEQPGEQAKKFLESALKSNLQNPGMPVMSGSFPIAAGGQLFYRSYNGITWVNLHDQKDADGSVDKAGTVQNRTIGFYGSLGEVFTDTDRRATLQDWIDKVYVQSGYSNLLYENSTVGTLTTDNRYIYAVDDLAVPIPPRFLLDANWKQPSIVHDAIKPLVVQNWLKAFNIATGKFHWQLGADLSKEPHKTVDLANVTDYINTHFLCAPISVGGRLYVLNEKNSGDLRLLCLDPETGHQVGAPQLLGTLKGENRYFHEIARRANAIHLAYAEGILVCPTNAGEILGVDLLTRSLAWAYKYREKPPNPGAFPKANEFQGGFQPGGQFVGPQNSLKAPLSYSNWKVAPPVIVDGKVVFTAPDASAVHCINLRDGVEIWSAPQHETDLFLAGVFLDKVVLVGKHSVRALRLSDGAPVWSSLETGDLPSGQGVASSNIYYLPLRRGEILAIDLMRWAIKAHNRASDHSAEAPGNLVFCDGMVLSQTPTKIVAYPQLATKLAEAEMAYTKEPSVENLLFRGELRMADGQLKKAVEDLSSALEKGAPEKVVPRARAKLFDAMGDLLQNDFNAASGPYLDKFKELCKVETSAAEQLQRETAYWRIVAKGREDQGDLVSAFLAYKEFGASPLFKEDGIPSLEDPLYKVPTHLWLRGRIGAMFEKANPAQRAGLEKKIAEEWQAVTQRNELAAIRQFIGMFDVPFAVGREARLKLAEVIIEEGAKEDYLQAEMNLEQLRVPAFREEATVGGRALEALARLELGKGSEDSLKLAAAYYREINKEFPNAALKDGKTGAQLFQALAEDPRLRPFLEESPVGWGPGPIAHRDLPGQGNPGMQKFVFRPEGDLTPQSEQYRLVLDYSNQGNPVLALLSAADGKERWKTNLGASPQNFQFFSYIYDGAINRSMPFRPDAKFRFFSVKGHLAVLQVGMNAYGIDLDAGKILWQHALYDPSKSGAYNVNGSTSIDERGQMWILQTNEFGQPTKARVGHIGAVEATYVALVTHKGLVVLDPLKGTPLWTKTGLATNTEMFGDDRYIYYVETADGSAIGAGRCFRASDGAAVAIPDFGFSYRNQQRILEGRRILTAEPMGKAAVTMRLYDVLTGKSLWKRTFENNPAVLRTEDANYCGVIERDTGKLIVVDLRGFKELVNAEVKPSTADLKTSRVSEDFKDLEAPLFLDDGDKFYVALNTAAKHNPLGLSGSAVSNFSNGTRCLPVNGWFCALDRKGNFLWHTGVRYANQMIVVEQFQNLPVLLFTSRSLSMDAKQGRPLSYVARSFSLDKTTGCAIWSSPQIETQLAQFNAFTIDRKAGTVNMLNASTIVQHFVEAGKEK